MASLSTVRTLAALAVVTVGFAPMLLLYLEGLWSRPHYQFFPVLAIAVGAMLAARWNAAARWEWELSKAGEAAVVRQPSPLELWYGRFRFALSSTAVLAGVGLGFLAVQLSSPWVSYVGFLIAGLGAVEYVGRGRVILWPIWALLAIVLRPPGNLDSELITFLQLRTAYLSSAALDLLGIAHVQEGVLIDLGTRTLFVEETCSGIQSLFSLLAVAAVFAVWNFRSLPHLLLLLLLAVIGAGAMNIVRTVGIVYALERIGVDLLAEPQHTIFGVVLFGLSLAWLACCDGFLGFLFDPISNEDDEASSVDRNLWVAAWNRMTGGPSGPLRHVIPEPGRVLQRATEVTLVVAAIASLLLIVPSVRAASALRHRQEQAPSGASAESLKQAFTRLSNETMPDQFDQWTKVGFEKIERPAGNILGQFSAIWTYTTPHGIAYCSCDYPFNGWHDLRTCYRGSGWTISDAQSSSSGARSEVNDILRFTLQKRSGETSLVTFLAVNEAFEPIPCQFYGGITRTYLDRIQAAIAETNDHGAVGQFQVVFKPHGALSPDALDDSQRHLKGFRETVLSQVRDERANHP
jgi:exosortase